MLQAALEEVVEAFFADHEGLRQDDGLMHVVPERMEPVDGAVPKAAPKDRPRTCLGEKVRRCDQFAGWSP